MADAIEKVLSARASEEQGALIRRACLELDWDAEGTIAKIEAGTLAPAKQMELRDWVDQHQRETGSEGRRSHARPPE